VNEQRLVLTVRRQPGGRVHPDNRGANVSATLGSG